MKYDHLDVLIYETLDPIFIGVSEEPHDDFKSYWYKGKYYLISKPIGDHCRKKEQILQLARKSKCLYCIDRGCMLTLDTKSFKIRSRGEIDPRTWIVIYELLRRR